MLNVIQYQNSSLRCRAGPRGHVPLYQCCSHHQSSSRGTELPSGEQWSHLAGTVQRAISRRRRRQLLAVRTGRRRHRAVQDGSLRPSVPLADLRVGVGPGPRSGSPVAGLRTAAAGPSSRPTWPGSPGGWRPGSRARWRGSRRRWAGSPARWPGTSAGSGGSPGCRWSGSSRPCWPGSPGC